MFSFESISRRLVVAAVLGLSFVSVESMAQSAQPFAGMSGVWSGKGSISLEGGAKEAIPLPGDLFRQKRWQCPPADAALCKRQLQDRTHEQCRVRWRQVDGTWSEATRNVSGDVQGATSGGRFQVVVSAGTFSADLVLNTRGNSQSVVIRSTGGEFKGANITLTRT